MARTDEQIIRLINRTKSTPVFVGQDDVTQDSDTLIELDTEGTAAEQIGDIFIFQYRRNHGGGFNNIMISVNGHAAHQVRVLSPTGSLRFWQVNDITRYAIYMVYRADGVWQLIGGTYRFSYPPFNFLTDVPNVLNTFEDDDVFLVGDVSGGAMRRGLFSRLKELFRPSAGKDGTVMIDDPSVYDFRGDGVSVSVVSGQARITIPPSVREVSSEPAAADLSDNELVVRRNSNNIAQNAWIKSARNTPFFDVTAADLGDGHLGYADSGYDALDSGYDVDAGGTSGYSALGAISENFNSMASSTFSRVGTYTIANINGLAARSNGNLVYVYSTSVTEINPADGTVVQSHTIGSAGTTHLGAAILGDYIYYQRVGSRDYYRTHLDTGATERVVDQSGASQIAQAMAVVNGTIYMIIANPERLLVLDPDAGTLTNLGSITGFLTSGATDRLSAAAGINGELYVIEETPSQDISKYLHILNTSTAALTSVGAVSPDNNSFKGLAQVGGILYAWNDTDNGIYRSQGGQGNRWEVVFPSTTTEVVSTDTTLRLFTSRGAEPITLNREAGITGAVVFGSDFDNASAHTISDGDNLELALYKEDDTPLYEGSAEAILQELQLKTPPIGT